MLQADVFSTKIRIATCYVHYEIGADLNMRISYKKLWMLLLERDISKMKFRADLKLATGTMAKLNKGNEVALSVLLRICEYLDCDIGDICEVVHDSQK